jgi:RNA polymerase sigma factor (sigma-70 family)
MLRRLQAPRAASHEDLFVERYERLIAWARQITGGDPVAAEDLVHDAFVNFTLSQPDLDAIQHVDGYLFTTLRHLHLANIRRGTRHHDIGVTLFEFESACDALRAVDISGVREELTTVCQYACLRRHSSKAGSVLILRFFHGYQVAEIARILQISANAVDALLGAARREARCWMEDPRHLRFLSQAEAFESRGIAFAGPITALADLQSAIFAASSGACAPDTAIARLYHNQSNPLDCTTLAHIVACRACLDRVNVALGLTPLSSRHPDDGVGPGPRTPTRRAGRESRRLPQEKGRQRSDRIAGARPTELRIAANGVVLCGQQVHDRDVSLHVAVQSSERLGFVEVLDERDVRLLLLSVEPVPEGMVEQSALINLTDERELAVSVSFASTWPVVTVDYRVPGGVAVTVETGPSSHRRSSESRHRSRRPLDWLPGVFGTWTWWPRPVLIALALLLIVLLMGPMEALSAARRVGQAVLAALSSLVHGNSDTPAPGKPSADRGDIELRERTSVTPAVRPRPLGLSERARLELSVEVLGRLDRVDALLGENLSLSATRDGSLALTGVVQDSERRAAIVGALGALRHIPQLHVRLQVAGMARATSTPTIVRSVEVVASRAPIRDLLDPRLALQAVASGSALNDAARSLSRRALDLSRHSVLHSWAVKRIASQVSEVRVAALDRATMRIWYRLLEKHARESADLLGQLRSELQSVQLLTGGEPLPLDLPAETSATTLAEALRRAADERDQTVRSLFAASADADVGDVTERLGDLARQLDEGLALARATAEYCAVNTH